MPEAFIQRHHFALRLTRTFFSLFAVAIAAAYVVHSFVFVSMLSSCNSTYSTINLYFLKVENISSGYSNFNTVWILEMNAPFCIFLLSFSPSLSLSLLTLHFDQKWFSTIVKWPEKKPFQSLELQIFLVSTLILIFSRNTIENETERAKNCDWKTK